MVRDLVAVFLLRLSYSANAVPALSFPFVAAVHPARLVACKLRLAIEKGLEVSLQAHMSNFMRSSCSRCQNLTPALHLYYPQLAHSQICLNTVSNFTHVVLQDCLSEGSKTYVAVAAKFSTLFASVTKLKQTLNIAVNVYIIASLTVIFRIRERTIMATISIKDETNVPRILVV